MSERPFPTLRRIEWPQGRISIGVQLQESNGREIPDLLETAEDRIAKIVIISAYSLETVESQVVIQANRLLNRHPLVSVARLE